MQRFLPWLGVLVAVGALVWLAVPMVLDGGGGEDVEPALERGAGDDAEASARLQGTGGARATDPTPQVGVGVIRGKVVAPDGTRVAAVAVEGRPWAFGGDTKAAVARRIYAVETGRLPVGDADAVLEGRTDEDGTFDLAAPRKKSYSVRALPGEGRCSASVWANLMTQDRAEITIRLAEAAPLDGRVLGPGEVGVEAVMTAETRLDGSIRFRGDPVTSEASTGAFRISDLPAGTWKVAVRIPGRLELTGLEVEVPHEGVWTIRLDEETGRVVGTVTDEDGQAIGDAQVLVHTSVAGSATRATALATTDSEGHYEMAAVPAGKVSWVEVLHRGYLAYSAREPLAPWSGAEVKRGEETRVDLVLGDGAVIEGRVFDVEDDRPIANARVMALVRAEPGQWRPAPVAECTTGKDGRFRLEGIPRGRVFLLATHPTHYLPGLGQARTRTRRRGNVSMQVKVPPPELFLVVGKATKHLERDLGLAEGAGVSGVVRDPRGAPVEGARIEVVQNVSGNALSSMGFQTPGDAEEIILTDAAGRFEILDLPPDGAVTLKASKPPYVGVVSDPVKPRMEGPFPEVEMRMQEGAVFEGRVVDAEGEGISHVAVTAWAQLPGGGIHQASTQTEADGSFRLEGAPVGSGILQMWGRGYARIAFEDVRPGEVRTGFELQLPRGVRVSGVLVDRDDRPVAGQPLLLTGTQGGTNVGPVTTDGRGRFTFESAPEGRVRLLVASANTPRQPGVRIGKPFASPAEGLRFVYEPPPVQVIQGRVLDSHGKAVPFCNVRIDDTRAPDPDMYLVPGAMGFQDEVVDGTFRRVIEGDGPWEIEVTEPRDLAGTPLNLQSAKKRIETVPKSAITFRLEPGDEVQGRVVDADGRGVPAVLVESGALFAFTDSAGRFVLVGLGGEGATVSIPEAEGYVTPKAQRIADLAAGIVFRLEPAARIAGRVVDPDGQSLPNAYVQVAWKTPDGRRGSSNAMAQGGRFEVEDLPQDAVAQLTVQVWSQGAGQTVPVVVKDVAAGTTDLTITVGGGVEISGTVVDEAGKPFTQGGIRLVRTDEEDQGRSMPYGRIQPDGTFRLSGLEPGRYTLSLQRNGSGPLPKPREIAAPAAGLRIVVPRGGVIAGRLVGDASFEGFRISLYQEGAAQGYSTNSRVARDGTFQLEGVGEGTYTLQARNSNDAFYGLLEGVHAGDENVEVHLQRGLSIAGTLLDASGKQVEKGWISVSGNAWNGSATVEDGRFEVRGLVPGTYQIRATARVGNTFSGWTELGKEEAGSTGLTLRLK